MTKPKPLPETAALAAEFNYDPISGHLRRKNGAFAGTLNNKGYLRCNFKGTAYKVHRIIWKMQTGVDPVCVDHINGNGSDNRWCNLRATTLRGNQGNRRRQTPATITLPGAVKVRGRWLAYGASKYLGSFDTEQEAHRTYVEWHRNYFGAMSIYAA